MVELGDWKKFQIRTRENCPLLCTSCYYRVASFYQSSLERTILNCKLSCNEHHYGHLESDRIYSYWKILDLSCSHSFRVIFWRDDSIPSGLSASYWRVVASGHDISHHHPPYSISMNICRTRELRLVPPTGEDVPTCARKLYTEDVSL